MKKLRPCLRCDKAFITTPEVRICTTCKASTWTPHSQTTHGHTHYAGYQEALGGLDYNKEITKAKYSPREP